VSATEPDVVHVWRISLDEQPAAAVDRLGCLLSPMETQRRAALGTARARSRFTVAHGALRLILSRRLEVPPHALRLRRGPWGKPEVAAPGGVPETRFSLSHSRGHALFAVTGRRAVGIDVEHHVGRPVTALALRHFPPAEGAAVRALGHRAGAVFAQLWTRKEACVKAAGARLADGLVLPAGGAGPGLVVHDPDGRLPGPWRVRDLAAPPGCGAAVALAGTAPYDVVELRFASAVDDPDLSASTQRPHAGRHIHDD